MNISAKELLMLDRAKFAKMNSQPVPTTSEESPVTNPQTGMKALEIQANNNIAFQGGMTKVAQNSVKKLAPMLAAGLFAALASQSCIKMDQHMEVDLSATNTLLAQLLEEIKKGNELDEETLKFIKEEAAKNEQFRTDILNYFKTDAATQEKLGTKLDDIIKLLEDGKINDQQALDMILDALRDIKDSVDNVAAKIDSLAADMNKNHKELMGKMEETLTKMGELIEVEKENGAKIAINGEKLDELIGINEGMAGNLANIEQNTKDLIAIVKDPVAFKEFIEQLNADNMDKFKALFEMLGLDITEVIEKAAEDLTGAMGDVQGAVEKFNEENTALNKEQIELQNKILEKMSSLEGKLDNLTDAQLAEIKILKEQFEALKGLGGDALDELGAINDRLDKVLDMLSSIYDAILSIGDDVAAMKDGQNKIIDQLSTVIVNGQIQNDKLDKLNTQIDESGKVLANIEQNTKDMIAIAKDPTRHNELIETIKDLKLGDEEYARFEAMFKAMGLNLSDVIKMSASELKSAIENFNNDYVVLEKEKLELQKDISRKISVLAGQLDGMTANQKAMLEKVEAQFNALRNNMDAAASDIIASLKDINGALDGIQATLNVLVEKVSQIADDIAAYKNSQAASLDILNKIFDNGKVQSDYLFMLTAGQQSMAENIAKIENNTYETYKQVKQNFPEFIEALKNLEVGTPDYTNMENALKAMGLTIQEAIKMNADQLEAALKTFLDTYVATEKDQTNMMGEIRDSIDKLAGMGVDTSKVEVALAMLTDAVKAGDADTTMLMKYLLQEVSDLKEIVKEGFANVGSQMGTMISWMNGFDNKFGKAIDAVIDNMGANTDRILQEQKYTNNYMANLNETAEEVKEALKELAGKTSAGSGITLAELEEMWQKHDDANFAKYSELFDKLGINLDKASADVVDAIKQLEEKMALRESYKDELNQIINLLVANNATLAGNAEKVAQIEEILKNMKLTFYVDVDCECGTGNESYPGDSYEQIEDLFKQ